MSQSTQVALTLVSSNKKTGPIPVSTVSATTCPPSCPLRGNGCYAASGPIAIHWRKVTEGVRGLKWSLFCAQIKRLPIGQLWRASAAGDLPGEGEHINEAELSELIAANKGRRGFTYTHKHHKVKNLGIIRAANRAGFTINLSANSPKQADFLAAQACGPVVTVLPSNQTTNCLTPAGRKIVICPATNREGISCATCQLCQKVNRSVIIGFPAHGTSFKRIDAAFAS